MHIITLSPVRAGPEMSLSIDGDAVIINGDRADFSRLQEGGTLPANAIGSDVFIGDVRRISGDLHYCLAFPHGMNAPNETLFPEPITVENGDVDLPAYEKIEDENG